MLFAFDNIWKTILIFASAWAIYGLCGYEFTVVTLLAAILCRALVHR